MIYVDREKIKELIDYKKLIDTMKTALVDIEKKISVVPDRHHIEISDGSVFLFMPVVSEKLGFVSFKYVGVCPKNMGSGIPAINGFVMLADIKTGIPKIFFDGSELTAVRTGAVGGVAIDMLCVDDAETAAVFGTGPQAKTQLEALLSVRNINKIYLYYRDKKKAENFINQFESVNFVLTDKIEFLREADVIIAATNSKKPLFPLDDVKLKPWVHINAIGSFKPNMQELDEKIYGYFTVFADNKDGCFSESGDFIVSKSKGLLSEEKVKNLGVLILNNEQAKKLKKERTVFKSVGNAVFDLYAAVHLSELLDDKSKKL